MIMLQRFAILILYTPQVPMKIEFQPDHSANASYWRDCGQGAMPAGLETSLVEGAKDCSCKRQCWPAVLTGLSGAAAR
jgi:hypothetical protein